MIILSNCLAKTIDEGSVKVAHSLIKGLKKRQPNIKIVSYERETEISDIHLKMNKLMLSVKLAKILSQDKEKVLYIPFPTRTLPLAIRVFVLSIYTKRKLDVIVSMEYPIERFSQILFKISKAKIYLLSSSSWKHYYEKIDQQAKYLRTGVDTKKFIPVNNSEKDRLRKKYKLPVDKPIVLHVGHLKEGRNIRHLLSLDESIHILLVTSTLTASKVDTELRVDLINKRNITLIESYIENIEEIYQLVDVYFFPVQDNLNCIDVPLSALEAASSGIPIVTTRYGELKEFASKEGFYFINSFEKEQIDSLIETAITEAKNPRKHILKYDWDIAVSRLMC